MDRGGIGRRRVVAGTAAGAVGVLAGARSVVAQDTTPPPANHPAIGSWLVTFTFEGQPEAELTNLITFTADGNVLAANAGKLPGLPPGAGLTFTEAHGAWAATGEQTADATLVFLTLDQIGGIASVNTIPTNVEVDQSGDMYTGLAALSMANTGGGSMGGERGTFQATRIKAEPLGAEAAASAP